MSEKYGSRKFIITLLGMIFGTLLAAFGKLDAQSAFVLVTAIGAYNMANVKGKEYESRNEELPSPKLPMG